MNATQRGGLWLVAAAAAFWAAWLMMPDAGTTDAERILRLVQANRPWVWWSSVFHLFSSVAFAIAVVGLQADARAAQSRLARIGAGVVLLGALGVCADAFFHLMAVYMTAPGVDLAAVHEPMRLLQTEGVAFLAPLLLCIFVGGVVYSIGLNRAAVVGRLAPALFVAAILIGVAGGAFAAATGQGRRIVVLGVFTAISLGYARIGMEATRVRSDTH